jgi:hypothetical protein
MSYSSENPDAPEFDTGALDDAREAGVAPDRQAPQRSNLESRLIPPHTLVDSEDQPVNGDAITEADVARLVGIPAPTLGRHRRDGKLNPKLVLRNASPVARPTGTPGVIVWYRRSLVEAIAASDTTEPFYKAS